MGAPENASLPIFRTGWADNMKQVLIRQGKACVEEIPAPGVEPGTILVKVARSCISIGTEMAGVKATSESLLQRALKRPEQVKKVLQMVVQDGLARTADMVKGRLSAGLPVGYSAAGVVVAVGEGVDDMQIGQRVACAGAQCAYHAEVIRVPRNLATPIPESLPFDDASSVTLGAIALQGVRRASPTLGESFVVVGLGILGQLTVQPPSLRTRPGSNSRGSSWVTGRPASLTNHTAYVLNSSVYRRRFVSAMIASDFTILLLIGVSVKSGKLHSKE